MTNYTDAAAIADHLGATFTPDQAAQAEVLATAVTVWIDHRTGRSWQDADGTVADEVQPVIGGAVYLAYRPATAVSQVETRWRSSGDDWAELAADAYVLSDPSTGRLEIPGYPNGYDARVDYTTSVTAAPADLAHAATVLAADLLFPTLHPETAGAESISVGQNDITIRYTTGASGAGGGAGAGPSAAVRVVDSYRRVVLA